MAGALVRAAAAVVLVVAGALVEGDLLNHPLTLVHQEVVAGAFVAAGRVPARVWDIERAGALLTAPAVVRPDAAGADLAIGGRRG